MPTSVRFCLKGVNISESLADLGISAAMFIPLYCEYKEQKVSSTLPRITVRTDGSAGIRVLARQRQEVHRRVNCNVIRIMITMIFSAQRIPGLNDDAALSRISVQS